MAYATITIPGDGSTTLLAVNFTLGVLENEVVTVQVTGEVGTRSFTWVSPGLMQVAGAAAPVGQQYVIRRRTPRDVAMVEWMDGEAIKDSTLTTDQMQALHLIHECLDALGDGGEGVVTEAPQDGKSYVRKNATWVDLATEAGSITAYSSRAAAQAATIPAHVNVIAVVHSNQVLFYRRFSGTTQANNSSALLTNGNTVFWNPAHEFSPLHWGAVGDGVTNDRDAFVRMFQFAYGLPPTVNTEAAHTAAQQAAFANMRPLVFEGHNRIYGTNGPIVLGNVGDNDYAKTGMVYRMRFNQLMLRALPSGNWSGMYDTAVGVPKALLIVAWQFPMNVSSDAFTGMYDVCIDHPRFDCGFLTSGVYIQGTYQFSMEKPRIHHMGKNGFAFKTSDHRAANNPSGIAMRNGALMVREANIEGLVTESGLTYPSGEDQITMNTTGFDIRSLDFRIDGPIISGVTRSMYIDGRAGQVYNLHPWARLVEIGPDANNLMFDNGYLDYTKFKLYSFKHMFVNMNWIIPSDPGSDRGVELVATKTNETAEGLFFTGCSFDHSLDIKFTTEGEGTWVGDKQKLLTLSGCRYGPGSTIAQIERFKNLKGITAANGAHWFRNGNTANGEVRLLADTVHLGKDRTADGDSMITLTGVAGDITSAQLRRVSGTNGALRLEQTVGNGAIALIGATHQAWFLNTGEGEWTGDKWMVGYNRPSNGAAEVALFNTGGGASASAAFRSFAGAGVEIAAQQSGGWMRFNVPGTENAVIVNTDGTVTNAKKLTVSTGGIEASDTGDIRALLGRIATNTKTAIAVTDTTVGVVASNGGQLTARTESSGAPLGASRPDNGNLITFGKGSTNIASIAVSGTNTISYPTASDERLKEDFQPIDTSIVDRLKVYDFAWKEDPTERSHGVKAQEAEGVITHLVTKSPTEDGEDYIWGVDYSKAVPLLIAAVQELRARVAELEAANVEPEPKLWQDQ